MTKTAVVRCCCGPEFSNEFDFELHVKSVHLSDDLVRWRALE